jgi:hypothetical protein
MMHSLKKKPEKLVKPACFLKQGCVKKAEAAGWVSPAAEFPYCTLDKKRGVCGFKFRATPVKKKNAEASKFFFLS